MNQDKLAAFVAAANQLRESQGNVSLRAVDFVELVDAAASKSAERHDTTNEREEQQQ